MMLNISKNCFEQIARSQQLSIVMSIFQSFEPILQESQIWTIKQDYPSKERSLHDCSRITEHNRLVDRLQNHLQYFTSSISPHIIAKMKQVYEESINDELNADPVFSTELYASNNQYLCQVDSRSQRIVHSPEQGDLIGQSQQMDSFLREWSFGQNLEQQAQRRAQHLSRKTAKKRAGAVKITPKSNVCDSSRNIQAKHKTADQIYEQNFTHNCLLRFREWREVFQEQIMPKINKTGFQEVKQYWGKYQKKLEDIIELHEPGPDFVVDDNFQKSFTVRKYGKSRR